MRARPRNAREKGELANVFEADYVIYAREEVYQDEKLCLRWRGPGGVFKALAEYSLKIEDLRTVHFDDVHGTRLKFYAIPLQTRK